jgi:hypothetical protein
MRQERCRRRSGDTGRKDLRRATRRHFSAEDKILICWKARAGTKLGHFSSVQR